MSQVREDLIDTEYQLVRQVTTGWILRDESGKEEFWGANDSYAGYVIVIYGTGHEFISSISRQSKAIDIRITEYERIVTLFRRLRAIWFNHKVKYFAPEQQWENEEQAENREQLNKRLWHIYDRQTEEIIAGTGEAYKLDPICANDLGKCRKDL